MRTSAAECHAAHDLPCHHLAPRLSRLNAIFDHIRRDSPSNAVQVITGITDAIDSLSTFPQRYTVVRGRRGSAKAVRLMPVPPYVVYYRVIERLRSVQVTTVRHGRQRRP